MSTGVQRTALDLPALVSRLGRAEGFADVVASLKAGNSATIDGAWGSSSALAVATLAGECPSTLLVVLPRMSEVDDFAGDVGSFLGEVPLVFPAWETLPQEQSIADAIFGGRLRVLNTLSAPQPPRVVVTCIASLLQPVPGRAEREQGTRVLRVGDELDLDEFLRWLVDRGFARVQAIEVPGEFCVHGGIVDLFPPDAVDPLRLEFFGDEIESIRRFDVESQRKLEDLASAALTLVAPAPSVESQNGRSRAKKGDVVPAGESFLDSLPPNAWVVLSELQDLTDEGRHYLERLDEPRGFFSVPATLERCTRFPTVVVSAIAADSFETTCHLQVESIERFTGPKTEVLAELAGVVGRDEQALIVCHNDGERERLAEMLAESAVTIGDGVDLCVGNLARGFRLVRDRIVVISDHELFGRADIRRAPARKKRHESRAIDSFLELHEGDLVVHLTHGIGRYRGMELIQGNDQAEEHLSIEFRDAVRVFVPVSLIHLVQKYVGSSKSAPLLSKLGSATWAKKKEQVARAVTDMASDMLRLQAARAARAGISYPADSHYQQEFEAAFPYTETVDQVHAIADLKEDMEKTRPMDRLICGDVGYGKTEVAIRAAFKAIDAGKQVAILVPTTILAEQHYRTFSERMAEYPVTLEVLSRFRTKAEQTRILKGLAAGSVDLVIGTHRLIQSDVKLKDLGLLIIDEEQRFGVEAKEMLKQLRLEVDVLTLSATPIPRTLHMSILGIRDISNLTTPPQDRQAIETRIVRFDTELIRSAIIRELNRNGQIYFVHNRVHDIQSVADRIQSIVPEASIAIGHGQMTGDELEDAMHGFVTGKTDILVCTTIIESGVDIPNANTIFIHRADNYGLADLHQLRGRVGRYKHRAYCYLVLEEGKTLTSTGAKRLKAIEEFSELGAGFRIAMRDLEIRGAGNILGTEQSGHIATVGYELYCQLLENAVRSLKKEPIREFHHVAVNLPVSAWFPGSYIPPGRHKIEAYRRLSGTKSFDELREFEAELRDRFGPIPPEVRQLLEVRELQIAAQRWQIDDVHLEEGYAVLGYRDAGRIRKLAKLRGTDLRVVDSRNAYLVLPRGLAEGSDLVGHLKAMLQPN